MLNYDAPKYDTSKIVAQMTTALIKTFEKAYPSSVDKIYDSRGYAFALGYLEGYVLEMIKDMNEEDRDYWHRRFVEDGKKIYDEYNQSV